VPYTKAGEKTVMANALEPNKAKIAKRVIEVFEFFNENSQQATVMDIVRRYGRPQSSTSELLATLVEMGLLYKDSRSRYYSPTPRLAALGISAQPEIIRNGHLFAFMDRLAQTTRNSVALFGMVGTNVQIFRLSPGPEPSLREIGYGACEQLSASAAGLLLLSTMPAEQASRILWRLNAEAPAEEKFNPVETREHVASLRRQGHAMGQAGFVAGVQMVATLLPRAGAERPLALGMMYPAAATIDTEALLATMNHGIAQCSTQSETVYPVTAAAPFMMAV
jgi:DNA-binding IclR family transcriptional regulator